MKNKLTFVAGDLTLKLLIRINATVKECVNVNLF